MARVHRSESPQPRSLSAPARTPEDREQQLIASAVDLAERQLLDGTASAQVITHYLKASSTRERLEQERIRRENILLGAKAEAMESAKVMERLYAEAITAMRSYAGHDPLAVSSEVADDPDGY
jgi:hypothetical protein